VPPSVSPEIFSFLKAVSTDIYKFSRAMNFVPTPQQRQLFDAVQRRERQIAVKSGQGPGKTAATCVLVLFRLLRDEKAKAVLTAPTMAQCRDVWLGTCRKLLEKADPFLQSMFEITKTSVKVLGADAANHGVIMKTSRRPENLQGQHAEAMDIIVEEASGVSRDVIEQFEGTLKNPDAMFLLIGNPTSRDCYFFDCFNKEAARWNSITWNAEETPKSRWFDPGVNKALEEKYGRDSDFYRIRVLGEFPRTDPQCLISDEAVMHMWNMSENTKNALRKMHRSGSRTPARQIGIDVARHGGDESVIAVREGEVLEYLKYYSHFEPIDIAAIAKAEQVSLGWRNDATWFLPDCTGMGEALPPLFTREGKQLFEFKFNMKAADPKYDNIVSEAWFSLAEKVRKAHCWLPNDTILMEQLSNRRYFMTKKGHMAIETKDDYVKRGHTSPDRADAVVLAMYDSFLMGGRSIRHAGKGNSDKMGKRVHGVSR